MERSEHVNELAGALAAAQSSMGQLRADNQVNAGTYSYSYADLASALKACMPALNAQGISVVQLPATPERNGITVQTMLMHTSGQWLMSPPLFMPVSGGAQDVGSAITYGRRYQLIAIMGLAPEDDDGAAAQAAQPKDWGAVRAAQKQSDDIGPRCRGSKWPGDLGRENEAIMRDIADAEGSDMGVVWDELLTRARIDLGPYVATDGRPPQTTADLSTGDGKAYKRAAQEWLRDIAGEMTNG